MTAATRSHAAPPLAPDTRIQFLPGVGPRRAPLFEKLGIGTVEDLLRHVPRTWLDARQFVPIAQLRPGALFTVRGEVKQAVALRSRGGRTDFTCSVADESGVVSAYFFGQSFLARTLRKGLQVVLSGEVDPLERRMVNPMFEVVEEEVADLLHVGRLVPVHPLTKGISARGLRQAVRRALDAVASQVIDPLPESVRVAESLAPLGEAFENIHFPIDDAALERARSRLAFDELFELQVVLELRRQFLAQEGRGLISAGPGVLAIEVQRRLPFELTADQTKAIHEIVEDLRRPLPMHRILVGDVGSGKTIVALMAALHVLEAGHQVAFMAPTEILARQHAQTLTRFVADVSVVAHAGAGKPSGNFGLAGVAGPPIVALTGSTPAAERKAIAARLAAGEPLLVVGTHALLEDRVPMPELALAIVDEQHRFGVRQRATLAKKGVIPDVLVLSATPIPRTLALARYGDLDMSELRSRPDGRGRLVTRVTGEEKFPQVIEFMAKELVQGRQAFVVVPLIEDAGRNDVKAAEAEWTRLSQHPLLAPYRVGLLHGRLKSDAKRDVMESFVRNEVQVLVATTVIEVGIDVPNATFMLVLDADRFGLSQLHQLRGRVGRGAHRSVCVLVPGRAATPIGRERLEVMVRTRDGFELAEADLRLRGEGDLWGVRQSGLPRFRIADLSRDRALLERARVVAARVVMEDRLLAHPEFQTLRNRLLERYREPLELALAG
ncbi:MAG: ATP-dependent DNA helicase RecG [Candidatus Eisenbacteria bacterium]|uniref:ATP-dependent DNA helicase RecG n=1 Tax=Eiseniibacteriota bacterium TaxID=2212470 RepID=A0A849SMN4_UNCEI|nr:ATP-dependent DNA helicase RecG [Candidatus Eisenbacteria bacterium]